MDLDVLHVFPSFAPGGIQMRLKAITASLPQTWSHTVVALDGDYSAFDTPGWSSRVSPTAAALPQVSERGLVGRLRAIAQWLQRQNPDVLISNNWGAIEWGAATNFVRGLGHIHTESGFGSDEAFTLNPKRGWFRRIALQRSDSILLCSQTLVKIAREQWRLPEHKTQFLPDGIDLQRFCVDTATPMDLNLESGRVVIGCVAPLRAEKNLTALLEAFDQAWQRNHSLFLAVAGDGPEQSMLEAYAATLASSASIRFYGFLSHIERFFKAIDLCALSSDTEQLPNSVLQGMAMGLPIAAFAVGDIPLMTAPENRPYLPPRRDVAGLAAAFTALASDARKRDEVGAANKTKCASTYSQAQMAQAYKIVIEHALRRMRLAA
ncbi:MAG: glycosyltransferase family 4 protein [Pseudomonadota bacterium]